MCNYRSYSIQNNQLFSQSAVVIFSFLPIAERLYNLAPHLELAEIVHQCRNVQRRSAAALGAVIQALTCKQRWPMGRGTIKAKIFWISRCLVLLIKFIIHLAAALLKSSYCLFSCQTKKCHAVIENDIMTDSNWKFPVTTRDGKIPKRALQCLKLVYQ